MIRDGQRIQRRRVLPAIVAGAALLAGTGGGVARSQGTGGDLLDKLEIADGKLGWDGVTLGMSLVQAERKLGVTLGLDKGVASGCPAFVASAQRNGVTLTLGFPSAKPGAKVEWLRVRFGGEALVVASAAELVAALRAKHPAAAWIRPADQPELAEADDYTPAYEIGGGKEPFVVEFVPRESLTLALRRCAG
jgi:hypothetical protein